MASGLSELKAVTARAKTPEPKTGADQQAPVLESKEEKFKKLEAVCKVLDQQFKTQNSLIRLDSKKRIVMPHISTGMPSVDWGAIGIGGLPKGRIIEIYGPEACLDGDTFVQYEVRGPEGKRQNHKGGSLRKLWHRFHGVSMSGKGHYQRESTLDSLFTCPSVNEDGTVFHNRIKDVVRTGDKETFLVTTKSGLQITATKDHKFHTGFGFTALESLAVGDTVQVHNNTPLRGTNVAEGYRNYLYVKHHPVAGVKIVDKKYIYHRIAKARAVIEALNNGMSLEMYVERLDEGNLDGLIFLPRTVHVHHLDEDFTNDSPDNLIAIEGVEHNRSHALKNKKKLSYVMVPDTIESIECVGVRETFDIKMESPYNNYVANGFVVHNSGKTTTTLQIIAEEQAMGNIAAFVDAEHALDTNYARALNVNTDELVLSQPDSGEQALETVEALVDSGAVTLIVVDSVAALVPQAELDGEMGDSMIGLQARLMSQAMRKLTAKCDRNGVTIIFINQLREKIGVMFGNPETTTGGKALKFYASVRIDIRRIGGAAGKIMVNGAEVGYQMKLKIVKNRVGAPFKEVIVDNIYGKGVDKFADTVRFAAQVGAIEKSGSWLSFEGERLGQGTDNAVLTLRGNPALMEKVKEQIAKVLKAQFDAS